MHLESVSGAYFDFGGPRPTDSSRTSYELELVRTLWTESAELVDLIASDTPLSLSKTDDAANSQYHDDDPIHRSRTAFFGDAVVSAVQTS